MDVTDLLQLSKRYHPDVNPSDASAKEKFQAVSEAYSVLGDDRRRRAYDRELSTGSSMGPTSSQSGQEQTYRAYYYYESTYENRRRGASYAWDHLHRTRGHASHQNQPPPPYTSYTWNRTHRTGFGQQHPRQSTRDPFNSAHVRRATGRRTPFETKEDRLKKESGIVRVVQVLGIIFFIVALNGGLRAST